jgi:hypothetical protein
MEAISFYFCLNFLFSTPATLYLDKAVGGFKRGTTAGQE